MIKINNKIKQIYSDIFINKYDIHPDNDIILYISRDYITLGSKGINWYSYFVTHNSLPDFHFRKECMSLVSKKNYTEIIDCNDIFWKSNDAKKIAYNMASWQLNPEYGIWEGRTPFDHVQPLSTSSPEWNSLVTSEDLLSGDFYWTKELGAWPCYWTNCFVNRSDDIYVDKKGSIWLYKDAQEAGESWYPYINLKKNFKVHFGSFKDGCTTGYMRFIARVIKHNNDNFLIKVFNNGLDYFIRHPEFKYFYEPSSPDISLFVNDGALGSILILLLDIIDNRNEDFTFITESYRSQCKTLLKKGMQMVLDIQLDDVITGKKTGWAQVYNTNLEPVPGRSFEPLGVCAESQNILQFLMEYTKYTLNNDENLLNIIKSVSNCIEFYIENAILDIIVHHSEVYGLTPQQSKSDEPLYPRYYDHWTQEDHTKFLNLLNEYNNIEDITEKCENIAEHFSEVINDKKIYHRNVIQIKTHYDRYLNNGGKTVPIYGDIDNGVYTKIYELSYERRKGYTWLLKLMRYEIEKYLTWISDNLFTINNPNSNVINAIIDTVESLKNLLQNTEYKYYSDEEYNSFIEKYYMWHNKVNIKIGLIGLGPRMIRMYDALLNLNNVEVSCVCDIQNSKASSYSNITMYNKYEEMLEKEDIKAVVISLPHHSNGYITKKCIEKGIKYIYEEKPFFWNINEGYELLDIANSNNAHIQVGSQLHSAKYYMDGVRLIRNNGLGMIDHIDFLIPWKPSNTFYNKKNDKIATDNLTHDLFSSWLKPNSSYVSNNASQNSNLLIKNNNDLLSGDWRDTIEYGGGLATAIGFHWWGFLFRCLNLTYSDYPKFKFIPDTENKYLVKIEIECPSKLNNKIMINYGFVDNSGDQEMIFYGENDKWMKFNYITKVTSNVDIDGIISNDTTLNYTMFDEKLLDDPESETQIHVNNWIKSIRYDIKPNLPPEDAFYANQICLIINAIYNINFDNTILWNTQNNDFQTENIKFKELINWKMYDSSDNKIIKNIIENTNNFTINSLGNCIYDNNKHNLVFSVLEDNSNIYLAESTDKNNWKYNKLLDNGINPHIIKFNDNTFIYYKNINNNQLLRKNINNSNMDNVNLNASTFTMITINNKLWTLCKLDSENIKCFNSDDGLNWIESNISINNDEIINLDDIIYKNNIYYLSCGCLVNNTSRINNMQFSTKIFYSYDFENWEDLLNQELLLDDLTVDDITYHVNPYYYTNPDENNTILYKYGCKFFKDNNDDITTNIYFNTKNGIIIKSSLSNNIDIEPTEDTEPIYIINCFSDTSSNLNNNIDLVIPNNQYNYISGNINNWTINAFIHNLSNDGYQKPYPVNNQCISLSNNRYININLKLKGKYRLSLWACGRDIAPGSNNLDISLSSSNNFIKLKFNGNNKLVPTNVWKKYTTEFEISQLATYKLLFQGTNSVQGESTEIQGISLIEV
tara:strand:- start:3022 stop:7329 length:4308 start_codon:yes stop_codon:yes gene_type:complete